MTGRVVVFFVTMAFALGLWSGPAAGADPSIDDLSKITVTGPLGPSARGTIERYIKHWVGRLASAKKVEAMVKARVALTNGYKVHSSPYWQIRYAEICAAQIPSVLAGPGRVRQIQAAMAAAEMPQYTIQPALEKMARHKNPAVRYWAVRGYRSATRRILLYPDRTRKMLATLQRLGLKDSGPVLAVVLRALSLYPNVDKDAARLRGTMDKVWLGRCKDIQVGRADVIKAYQKAAGFLMPIDKADEKLILQLLTDALEAASRSFVKPGNQKGRTGKALTDLLGALEARLTEITSTSRTPLQQVLSERNVEPMQKAAKGRLAVNEYWKPLLAGKGVKTRVRPLPTTNPTTMAAASK